MIRELQRDSKVDMTDRRARLRQGWKAYQSGTQKLDVPAANQVRLFPSHEELRTREKKEIVTSDQQFVMHSNPNAMKLSLGMR